MLLIETELHPFPPSSHLPANLTRASPMSPPFKLVASFSFIIIVLLLSILVSIYTQVYMYVSGNRHGFPPVKWALSTIREWLVATDIECYLLYLCAALLL